MKKTKFDTLYEEILQEVESPCWDGYERVPNTKKYEKGSCRKKKHKKKTVDESKYYNEKTYINPKNREEFYGTNGYGWYTYKDNKDLEKLKRFTFKPSKNPLFVYVEGLTSTHLRKLGYIRIELQQENINTQIMNKLMKQKREIKDKLKSDEVKKYWQQEDINDLKYELKHVNIAIKDESERVKKPLSEKIDKEKMPCNKPRYLRKGEAGYGKKQKVVKGCEGGKEAIVKFGDANMENKSDNPKNKKKFRKRHKCDNPGSKLKARYHACKDW
jgi:hypothetical protein